MDPHDRAANSSTPPVSSAGAPTSNLSHISPAIDILPPPSLRSPPESADSPSLNSLKSVDSAPVTGIYPFGSLRVINEPRHDDTAIAATTADFDMDLTTPLTIPDRTPELSVHEDQELELELLKGGDVLILDDLPATFTVGCDTISFSTTQQFLGFRDIPPGAHLIWVASSESTSTRSGYWLVTPEREEGIPGRVYVKQWDKFNELLSDPASQAEERFQRERLGHIFQSLAPYQFKASTSAVAPPSRSGDSEPLPAFLSNTTIWSQLTSAITPALLNSLAGEDGNTWAVNTSDRIVGETTLPEEARLYPSSEARLRFRFPMDQPPFDPKAEGAARTEQAMDPTTWVLSVAVGGRDDDGSDDDDRHHALLGELQFAFLTGMHLGNFSCLEQWWHYVTRIVFRAYRMAVVRPALARRLLETFHAQLVYSDRYLEGEGVLETMPDNAHRLRRALAIYKSRLTEQLLALGDRCDEAQHGVGRAFEALESWLWRLGWDLRDVGAAMADGGPPGAAAVAGSRNVVGSGAGDYVVRAGKYMLEDGEMVDAELEDGFESEDERGEFAAVVVDLDENGRPTDLVSV